jgi:hypothetical protein
LSKLTTIRRSSLFSVFAVAEPTRSGYGTFILSRQNSQRQEGGVTNDF